MISPLDHNRNLLLYIASRLQAFTFNTAQHAEEYVEHVQNLNLRYNQLLNDGSFENPSKKLKVNFFIDAASLPTMMNLCLLAQNKDPQSINFIITRDAIDHLKLLQAFPNIFIVPFKIRKFDDCTWVFYFLLWLKVLYSSYKIELTYTTNYSFLPVSLAMKIICSKLKIKITQIIGIDDGALTYSSLVHNNYLIKNKLLKYKADQIFAQVRQIYNKYINNQDESHFMHNLHDLCYTHLANEIKQLELSNQLNPEFAEGATSAWLFFYDYYDQQYQTTCNYYLINPKFPQILDTMDFDYVKWPNSVIKQLDINQLFKSLPEQQQLSIFKIFAKYNDLMLIDIINNESYDILLLTGTVGPFEKDSDELEYQFKLLLEIVYEFLSRHPHKKVVIVFKGHPRFKQNDQLYNMIKEKITNLQRISDQIPTELFISEINKPIEFAGFYSTILLNNFNNPNLIIGNVIHIPSYNTKMMMDFFIKSRELN